MFQEETAKEPFLNQIIQFILLMTFRDFSDSSEESQDGTNSTNSKQQVEKIIAMVVNRVAKGIRLKKGTYQKYLDYLKTKPMGEPMENHHVIPKHQGGSNSKENLIRIGKVEHVLAHLLLYLEQGNDGDLKAYIFRRYTKHVNLTSQSQKARALDKLLKRGRFNSSYQRQLGLKGGAKGGSANTPDQFRARSLVGKDYGRQTGLGNQSMVLKEKLSCYHLWQHEKTPTIQIMTQPAEAAVDILSELNQQCERLGLSSYKVDLNKAKKGGFFYSFLKGLRPSYFGWRIVESISADLLED